MITKLVVCLLAINYISARHIDESPSQTEGLYDSSDDVLVLTNATFTDLIFNQNHATLVEFYNSFCGFCRKYAPAWKAFASDVNAWQSVVQVAAVNCATDENSSLCRKYEVMAYPSLRYFPPHFNDPNTWGTQVQSHHESDKLRSSLVELLQKETSNMPANWPKLLPLQAISKSHLFDELSDEVKSIIIIYVSGNSTIPNEVALDFIANPYVTVKWINTTDIASRFGLSKETFLSVVNRKFELIHLSVESVDRQAILQSIRVYLNEHKLNIISSTTESRKETEYKNQSKVEIARIDKVYLKDLQHAAWYSLNHEVTQFSLINGERLVALQQYINIIKRSVLSFFRS